MNEATRPDFRQDWRENFYWPWLIWNEFRWYLGHGRPVALLRSLLVRLHGDRTETCQECGRGYLLWRAPDDLWRGLIDKDGGGILCLRCFDRKAEAAGILLQWVPRVFRMGVTAK